MPRLVRVPALMAACVFALAVIGFASADGEAGLVIQHGDGTTDAFCIAFSGDSISGDELLRRANVPVVQFSGLVCAIGPREGCFQPSSFESCACQCKGNDCTYWAFFTQRYGASWRYSAIGYQGQESKDGDLQGWKWGQGGPNSAPAPQPITFEQICGHAPRGGAALPTPTTAPTATLAAAAPTAPSASALTPSAAATESFTAAPPTPPLTGTPLITIRTPASTPGVPALGGPPKDDGGARASGLLAFVAIAAALAAAVATAVVWRRRHGA
ncbi:MAG: hypothetical protein ACR2HN_02800 [Tepidiformaceae bacterium]